MQQRANYDAYYRRELPRLVRSHLESVVDSELQTLESALRSRLDDIIKDCLDQVSANYVSPRTIGNGTTTRGSGNTIPAPIPLRVVIPPTPAEVQCEQDQNDAIENLTELMPAFDDFAYPNQFPGPPPTPAEPGAQFEGSQPTAISTAPSLYSQNSNMIPADTVAPDCYCPIGSCTCRRRPQYGLDQVPGLPPAAFQFNTPTKNVERIPIPREWNPGQLMADVGVDDSDMIWDDWKIEP
jgi:hypothetical protein